MEPWPLMENNITRVGLDAVIAFLQEMPILTQRLLDVLRDRGIALVEDVCESPGATFAGRKCGTFGLVSSFSFYFAHHMSTIEGGMVGMDDEELYQRCRMWRSHDMTRE